MKPNAVVLAQVLPRNAFDRSVPKILEPLNNLASTHKLGRKEDSLLGFNISDKDGYGINGNSWHPLVNVSKSWFPNSFPEIGADEEHINIEVGTYIRTKQGLPNLNFNLQGLALKVNMPGLSKEFVAPFDKDGKARLEMLPSGEYSLEIVSLKSI